MDQKDQRIKELEQALANANAMLDFYRAAIDSLPNPIFLKGEDLRFLFFNKSYRDFFHLEEGQYIGLGVEELPYLSANDRRRYHHEDSTALENSSAVHYETAYPQGTDPRESLYWSKGFSTPSGQRGLIGEIVDISKEKQLERELQLYVEELKLFGRKAEAASMLDPLTKLYNRRVFDEHIPMLIRQCRSRHAALFVMLMDLDHFKEINDTYGHATGDEILKTFSTFLMDNTRRNDFCIRYGGDEFLALLPGISESRALSKAEYICQHAANMLRLPNGQPVTFSLGAAFLEPEETIEDCIQRADQALYVSKAGGRNQVTLYHKDDQDNPSQ